MSTQENTMFHEINFKEMGDDRGFLVAMEGGNQIPFDIKRVFYVYGSEGDVIRGCHANRNTQFVLISVNGSCAITVKDAKTEKYTEVILDSPTKGLYLNRMVWKEMHNFSTDAVLLVLCSEYYDKNEYIHDFDEYLVEMKNAPII